LRRTLVLMITSQQSQKVGKAEGSSLDAIFYRTCRIAGKSLRNAVVVFRIAQ